MKDESTETAADEQAETAAEQETEPTESHIPEEWQKQAQALVAGANDYQLTYLQSCISECRDKAMRSQEFSDENMPS